MRNSNQTITWQNGRRYNTVSPIPLDEFNLSFSGKKSRKTTKNGPSAEEIGDLKFKDRKSPQVRSALPTILQLWSPLPQQNIIKHGHIAKFLTALEHSPTASRSATLLHGVQALVDNPTKPSELQKVESDFFNELSGIRESLAKSSMVTSVLLNALPSGQLRDACIAYVLQQDNLDDIRQAVVQDLETVKNPAMRTSMKAMVRHSSDFSSIRPSSEDGRVNHTGSSSPLLEYLASRPYNAEARTALRQLYSQPPLPDDDKRQIILSFMSRSSYYGYSLIVPVLAAVGTFQDPEKRATLIKELQQNPHYYLSEGLHLANLIQAPERIAQLDKKAALPSLAAEGLKPFIDRGFSMLDIPELTSLLKITGRDAGALISTILPAYDEVLDFALKHPDKLVKTGSKPPSEDEIRARFQKQGILILKALILTGVPTLKSTIYRKRLDNLLEMIPSAIKCSELLMPAHQLTKMTEEPVDNYKLVEYIASFSEIHKEKELRKLMEKMVQSKKLDVKTIGKAYLTTALDNSALKDIQISDDQVDKWDMKYLSTLASALRGWSGSQREELIALCKAALQGRVQSYLHDPNTKVGQNNLATQQTFETTFKKLGLKLNYQQWLHYPGEVVFNHQSDNRRNASPQMQQLKIKLWDRNPGRDLFLGNYTGACIALDSYGDNSYASVQANQNTFVQVAYLYDETKKVVGKGLFYWGKNIKTGEPVLILNTFEGRAARGGGYEHNQLVRDNYVEFAKQYSRAVLGYAAPLYTGMRLNPLYRDDLKDSPIDMHVVGSALNNRYYLDSLPDNGDKIDAHHKPNHRLQLLDSGESRPQVVYPLPATNSSFSDKESSNRRRHRANRRVTREEPFHVAFEQEQSPFAIKADGPSRLRNQREIQERVRDSRNPSKQSFKSFLDKFPVPNKSSKKEAKISQSDDTQMQSKKSGKALLKKVLKPFQKD